MFDCLGGNNPLPPERNTAWNKGRKSFHCLGAPNNLIRPWIAGCVIVSIVTCPRTLLSHGWENLCWYNQYVLLKILCLILIFSLRFMLMTVSYRNVHGRRPNSFWKKKKRTSVTSHFLTPNSDASLVKTQQRPMIFPLSDVKLSEKPRARMACWLSRSCGFFVNGHQEADRIWGFQGHLHHCWNNIGDNEEECVCLCVCRNPGHRWENNFVTCYVETRWRFLNCIFTVTWGGKVCN